MEENQKKPEYTEYNATLDEDPAPESSMSADEMQESILEDSGMNGFQKAIARMSEKTWIRVQRAAGVVLGAATGAALFWKGPNNDESGFSYSLVVAIVIAMLIPNIIEKQGLRRIPKLRLTLAISLAVIIVIYFLYWGFANGFRLTA